MRSNVPSATSAQRKVSWQPPTCDVVLSGYTMEGLTFHGVDIDEERIEPKIDRIDVPDSVHEALERSFSEGFDKLLEQLADRRWVEVSLALIEGNEVPSARVSLFVRPPLDKLPLTHTGAEESLG